MDANLRVSYEQVMQAEHPEDLFGAQDIVLPEDALLEHLQKVHAPLRAATDPEMYQDPEDREAAKDAHRKLARLYAEGQERIRQHIYGLPGRGLPRPSHATKHFDVGGRRYYVGQQLVKGPRSSLFEGFLEQRGEIAGEVVLKVASVATSNHFLQNEARALDLLHQQAVPQWKHLPFMLDRFMTGDRLGLIYRKVSGFTVAEIRQHRAHRRGVDQRHIAWMLDRTLSCLGYVHRCGIVHGNLTPDHIIVQPASHNAVICGWSAAVHKPAVTGESVSLFSHEFSAPEVRNHGNLGPWSDIYSLGKLMIWLIGGNPADNSIPDGVETTVSDFLRSLVQEDLYKRPADAWELYEQQCRIKDALWPRQFLHFDMA